MMQGRLSDGLEVEFLGGQVCVCGEDDLLPKVNNVVNEAIILISSLNDED